MCFFNSYPNFFIYFLQFLKIYNKDHSDGDLDTEDEELMKEAKLVHLKHAYPHDSDDTSDFEEMEEEEAMVLHDMKQFQVQQV